MHTQLCCVSPQGSVKLHVVDTVKGFLLPGVVLAGCEY